ncbi:ABC transporter ATP-binding protein [Heliorestis acidaminivorans]|uniref:ABC-type quaternary amine transporter n=1 Tax=Heliorestis acidaminivorans TaxID=553427 RepID=A0A6I0F5F1_9FIRM|nr:ABC transporter ATP-binding protein [Heliorestis acidaminivorans]KAB2954222.1 ABC transporter ATP-binding protein [Heliorestis acidaminivorans]
MIKAQITKKLPSFDLELQFEIPQGAVLGLFGPSGCGKSITLRCLAGLLEPDQGFIKVGEQTFFDNKQKIFVPARKRKIGFLFQNYALFPHLTVEKNITFGLKDLPKEEQKKKAHSILTKMRLVGFENRYPFQLSGGQQQRVALARTLVTDPSLLLLDEPFSALDSQVKSKLEKEVIELKNAYSGTMILVSHSLEEAYRLCSHIAVMENGRILQFGSRDEIVHQPVNRTVARFVGTKNIFDGSIIARNQDYATLRLRSYPIDLKVPNPNFDNTKVSAGIRPSKIRLFNANDGELKQRENTLQAKIVQNIIEPDGQKLFLKLDIPFVEAPTASTQAIQEYDLQVQVAKSENLDDSKIYHQGESCYIQMPVQAFALWPT